MPSHTNREKSEENSSEVSSRSAAVSGAEFLSNAGLLGVTGSTEPGEHAIAVERHEILDTVAVEVVKGRASPPGDRRAEPLRSRKKRLGPQIGPKKITGNAGVGIFSGRSFDARFSR